jgi:hypothetical protein
MSDKSRTGAARIMTRLVEAGAMSAGGVTRSFLNDCIIAASAREHGFVLVTRNARDFALIKSIEPGLEYTPPWPEPCDPIRMIRCLYRVLASFPRTRESSGFAGFCSAGCPPARA